MSAGVSDDDIRERIIKVYRTVSPGHRPPRADGAGELDSMAFLEFISSLEAEFNITVKLADLNETNFKTTDTTVSFIRGSLSSSRS